MNPPPWKGSNTLSSVTPMTQRWWMHFPLCPWGWRQGVAPTTVLHIAGTWRGNPPFVIVTVAVAVAIAIAIAVTIAVSIAIAVNVAVAYCPCHRHWPLLLQLPSPINAAISFASPSAIAIAVALELAIAVSITIGNCSHHHHWPSPLLLPLPIAESCYLGMARIVFEQFKQIMLTLSYFVWTVGGALIKARLLTRRWAAMANTSIGRQAASSKRLLGEVAAGSRGRAAGWRQCLTMGWVVLLGCCVACHGQMAFVMICWMW